MLSIRGLVVEFPSAAGTVRAVDGVGFEVRPGETVGVVGESGSGKSVTALAALGLVPYPGRVAAGEVELEGRELLRLGRDQLRSVRGRELAMVFQDPLTSLHPAYPIGAQVTEAVRAHRPDVGGEAATARAVSLLDRVGIPRAPVRASQYPHEWSGGMRQRAMIAMAIANRPKVLIADEPTTALDVVVQAQILELLREIQRETGMGMVVITHDMGVIAETADRVVVMHAGRVAETGTAASIFHAPRDPRTAALMAGLPRFERSGPAPSRPVPLRHPERSGELLRAESVVTSFDGRRGGRALRAVDGVSLSLRPGESVGLVGESGCGKTTLARTLARLLEPSSGRLQFKGEEITHRPQRALASFRRQLGVVFQDPFGSLNPRMRVGAIVAQPLRIHRYRGSRRARVAELFELVGLARGLAARFPHELSGGERQRVGIARALALDPEVLLLDEPVSSLDASIRAQILSLLADLRDRLGIAYLLISHDISTVRRVCERIAVMHLGRIVEMGDGEALCSGPTHPYTQSLLAAVPITDPSERGRKRRIVLRGELPDPADPPPGCRFRTRCWKAGERCAEEDPRLTDRLGIGRPCACLYAAPPEDASGDDGP